jgi:hypothetical protein
VSSTDGRVEDNQGKPSKQNTKLFSFAPRFEREKTLLLAARGFRKERAILSDEEWSLRPFRVTPK